MGVVVADGPLFDSGSPVSGCDGRRAPSGSDEDLDN